MRFGTYKLILAIVLVASISGCANTINATIKPSPIFGQEIVYIKDAEFVGSKKTNRALVGPITTSLSINSNPVFFVVVANKAESEMDFSTENIRVAYGDRVVRVLTGAEFSEYLEWKKIGEIRSSSMSLVPSSPAAGKLAGALSALSYLSNTAVITERFDELKNMVLRGSSLKAGEAHGGLIMLQELQPSDVGKPLIMLLKVGQEIHEFRFSIINET